jgi:hypothetical protein
MKKNPSKTAQAALPVAWTLEAEVVPGLESLAANEIIRVLSKSVQLAPKALQQPSGVRFSYRGDLQRLEQLQVAQAVYVVNWFDIPRPKALLGNTEFRVIRTTLNAVIGLAPFCTSRAARDGFTGR